MVICIHHSADMDGIASAKVVEAFNFEQDNKVGFMGIDRGYNFADYFDKIASTDTVYLVDFSLTLEEMIQVKKRAKQFYYIDHHISAINTFEEAKFHTPGLLGTSVSACALAYKFLTGRKEVPKGIKLLSLYDTGHFTEETMIFQLGAQNLLNLFESGPWIDILYETPDEEKTIAKINEIGKILKLAVDDEVANDIEDLGFEVDFEGRKCFAINNSHRRNEIFEIVKDQYDIIVCFIYAKDKWKISMRSKNFDVSKIAEKYGGGGHRFAAAFRTDKLPFL